MELYYNAKLQKTSCELCAGNKLNTCDENAKTQFKMQNTVITTMDIIPRRSKDNVFANRVKELSNSITCMNETYHRHASTWMIFSFEIDSQAWENGQIEYLESRHKRDTKREKTMWHSAPIILKRRRTPQ